MMAPESAFEITPLTTLEQFGSVVRLQQEIWGFQDVELLPLRLFVVASKIGGQVLGAFDHEKMIAFCLCIPGLKPTGQAYLYSHMLGVLPKYRNTGLGRRLKRSQRDYAMRERVDLIEWTFDPLEIKNAFFNVERLGAIVRRYVPNQYGTTTSHLHGGLPTDRLIAEWWIRSPRVEAISTGRPFHRPSIEASVSVPADISDLRKNHPHRAREIQASIGDQFAKYFQAGLAVVQFEKNEQAGTYLLGKWESK